MKRLITSLCLTLILLLPAPGCGKKQPVTAEIKGNGTPLSELHEPPILTVSCKGQTVQAVRVMSEWKADGVTVDGTGKFLFDYYLSGKIEPASADGKPVTLLFETMPDHIISLKAWNIADITEDYEYSQVHDAIEIAVSDNRFILPEEGVLLYAFCVEWEEQDGVGGDASYAFILSARTDETK